MHHEYYELWNKTGNTGMSQKHLSSCCCRQPSICNPCPLSYFRQVLSFSTCWLAVDLSSADQHSFLFVVHSSVKFKTAVILRTKISLHGKCHVKTVYCTNKHITGSNFLRCYVATVVTYTGCINRIGLDLWLPSPPSECSSTMVQDLYSRKSDDYHSNRNAAVHVCDR